MSNVCIGQVLAEIFGGLGGRHVVGLGFGGLWVVFLAKNTNKNGVK
jgi:hypothetical protein